MPLGAVDDVLPGVVTGDRRHDVGVGDQRGVRRISEAFEQIEMAEVPPESSVQRGQAVASRFDARIRMCEEPRTQVVPTAESTRPNPERTV
jgi:hypothetical protein